MKPSENYQRWLGAALILSPFLVIAYLAQFQIFDQTLAYILVSAISLTLVQAPRFQRSVASTYLFLVLIFFQPTNVQWLPAVYGALSLMFLFFSRGIIGYHKSSFRMIALGMWLAILLRASGPEGGADPLREFLMRYLPSESSVEFAVIAIRKSIHFVFYGIMAAMAYLSQDRETRSSKTIVTVSLFVVLCEAILDEVRQSQFANRTGSAWDVVLDLTGAVFALWLMNRRDKKPTESVLS